MTPIKVINIDDMVKTFYTESDFIQYVNIIILFSRQSIILIVIVII